MAAPQKRPSKGILKTSSSFDKASEAEMIEIQKKREMTWDEMNILATYHPSDKDYGYNKIDEPPTPYNYMSTGEEDESGGEGFRDSSVERHGSVGSIGSVGSANSAAVGSGEDGTPHVHLDPLSLASRLVEADDPKEIGNITSESENDEHETEEERAQRKEFEKRRKMHYNEFQAVRLAKQLMAEEDDEEEEYDDNIKASDIVIIEDNAAAAKADAMAHIRTETPEETGAEDSTTNQQSSSMTMVTPPPSSPTDNMPL